MVVASESTSLPTSTTITSIMDGKRQDWLVVAHCSFGSEVATVRASTAVIVATIASY